MMKLRFVPWFAAAFRRAGTKHHWIASALVACGLACALAPARAVAGTWIVYEDGDGSWVGDPPGPGAALRAEASTSRLVTASPRAAGTASLLTGPTINVSLSSVTGAQSYPSAISDGAGGTIVVWHDNRDPATGYDIYAQHLLSCGVVDPDWPAEGLALTRAIGDDFFPVVTTDGAGGAIVAWTANFTGPAPTGSDVYAQRVLAGGMVDPAWPANGLPVCVTPGGNRFPRITTDDVGGAYLIWDDARAGRRAYIQHLIATGADPNPAWTPNGVLAGTFPAGQTFPAVCRDGSGGAIVAWNDQRTGILTPDIYAQRFAIAGVPMWPPTGVPVTTSAGAQRLYGVAGTAASIWLITASDAQSSAITPDGAGGCFLAWADSRSLPANGDDIYVQHLTSAGAVAAGWPADGLALCTAPGHQDAPTVLPDGSGGAIATWQDTRLDAFIHHVSGAGVLDGPVDGLGVAAPGATPTVAGNIPEAVSDGTGGAILSWSDTRNALVSGLDLFAQHVTTFPLAVDGAWPVGGVAVSTAVGDQYVFASLVPDGAGGFVAGWEDERDAPTLGSDIYGQRVLADGTFASYGVSGTVTASCPAPGTGLLGVVVDAFEIGTGELSATTVTDASGAWSLPGLDPGAYTITVMTPLGYVATATEIAVEGCPGSVDFPLQCVSQVARPRTIGFWKHQVGVATGGKGTAQVSGGVLCGYLDLIAAHFNSNALNEVIVYQPPVSGTCPDKLQVAKQLLNLTGSVDMIDRARQQLLALLLNVAAGYMGQTLVISADGATVSQAITYCDNVIDNPIGDHELAKTIADIINNGQLVPAGMIPLSTESIAYARGGRQSQFRVSPNPARGSLRFLFTTTVRGPVSLTVFDIAGRTVAKVVDGELAAGAHVIPWSGERSARGGTEAGVYFARLRTADGVSTLRLLQMRR